ncbi:MAG: UDP-N-acetylglucosamine--N-acetylmuramyl-(pentapeptide) pyrophosphoryl-undecaprenol N-acetylglucosamine transferase [Anaerolineales bacterium]|nr:MAG: UDP-N-acetylglucosamine--N-acetylmuramyl-(pentapeptide) pyrophosphoryl-undecaprenol N-acetylglucosamine transferase [Anaerolineales bacterium]
MRLLVAAGASGGGVYPALAALQELGATDLELLWVGGQGGMEEQLVTRAGLTFTTLPAAGLHGVGLAQLPRNLWQLLRGWLAARRILARFKPDALFFTGGFVAAPIAMAGRRVPTLAFVPDARPGFTLRFIARFADVIATVASEVGQYFDRPARVQVTGYPVRAELAAWAQPARRTEALRHFGLSADVPVLLIFGGSKGAQNINRAAVAALPDLLQDMQVIHISGEANWDEVNDAQAQLPPAQAARYRAFPYLHEDMGAAFAAADLAVCRAGASTFGELPLFQLPAVLVPIPFKQHIQHDNAALLSQRGAAMVLPDERMGAELAATVRGLLADKPRLADMRSAMAALAMPDAAARLAGLLRQLGAGREAQA